MAYELILTENFTNDLDSILDYFINSLYNKTAAVRLYSQIKKSLVSATDFPEMFPIHKRFGNGEYHFFTVGNFIVFYSADHDRQTVFAEAVVYGKRDIALLE